MEERKKRRRGGAKVKHGKQKAGEKRRTPNGLHFFFSITFPSLLLFFLEGKKSRTAPKRPLVSVCWILRGSLLKREHILVYWPGRTAVAHRNLLASDIRTANPHIRRRAINPHCAPKLGYHSLICAHPGVPSPCFPTET